MARTMTGRILEVRNGICEQYCDNVRGLGDESCPDAIKLMPSIACELS